MVQNALIGICAFFKFYTFPDEKKVKLSRYTPWRHMGGEKV
jgi:hypothetical protein